MTRRFPPFDPHDYAEDSTGMSFRSSPTKTPPLVLTREQQATPNDNSWGQILKPGKFPGTTGNKPPLQLIQKGDFSGPPAPRGILLTRGSESIADTAGGCDVKAVVTWGVGGFRFTSRFDWSNGATLLIPGGTITVEAEIVPTFVNWPQVNPDPANKQFELGAMFFEKAATNHTAQYTESYYQLGTLQTSWQMRIPEFAKTVRIWLGSGLVLGDANVRFYGPALGFDQISIFDCTDIAAFANQPIGVPGNAGWLEINTTNNLTPTVIWDLSL